MALAGSWSDVGCTYPSIHFSLDEDTLKSTVGCLTSTYPSIHVETPSRSRSVVWCVLCVHVARVVCGLCVGCGLFCCGGACVWCLVKLGIHSLSCSLSFLFSFPFFFSPIFIFISSFSFSFSLAPSLTLALEAFECDLVQSKCTAIGSLPPPLSSLLPLPSSKKKKEGTFYCRNISGEGIIFNTVLNKIKKIAAGETYSHYSFKLIRKQ